MKSPALAALLVVTLAAIASTGCSSAPGDEASSETSSAIIVIKPVPVSPCPTVVPATGSACGEANLECSWGDDPRFACRTVKVCSGGTWESAGRACSATEPTCPSAAPTGSSPSCTSAELGLTCVYDHEAYTCAPCTGNLCFTSNRWFSTALAAACPATVPNLGEECAETAGTACNYDACADDGVSLGVSMTCTDSFWKGAAAPICL